jgi:DNA-binding NarL/FixJ family response regulator
MNVLLYDNSNYLRTMIQRNLVQLKASLKINSVDNMGLVINELSSSYYDLIIVDMDSLGGKYSQLLRAKHEYNSDTILIMLSSFPNKKIFEKFFACGVNYCLDKVSEFETLLQAIEEIISNINNSSSTQLENFLERVN